ncbi:alpha/beta fold hydrolase [Paenibacillus mendelii]|uniref:Alpha/beta fold hydrolase n=1 Tax=Paenibacillus mendelii TaxID=206163 RepID=A0ABV6J3A2_9BACL|nr:alpha/beta hydrolase [Paenibacillus mendelii]MCQ6563334.1 alpha/beta hydrolase [Paenibacillus mendelii]
MPYANINGTKLYYETYGSGIPIVFIHPPLLTSANFRYQQAQLSAEYQVITFDIRGHGSSRPSDVPITYKLIVEDMRQLLNYLKIDRAFVAGYSTGGSIALEALLTYPGLFMGGILISAMSEASDFVLRSRIRIAIGLSSWKPAVRLLRLGITWGNSDSLSTFRNLLEDSKRGHKRNILELYKYSLKYNCTDRLSDVKAPVLLLYGEKDWGFKRYRKILQQNLRRSKLVLLKAEKHQLPTKAADEINEAMRHWIVQAVVDKQTKQKVDEMENSIPEAFIVEQKATGEQSQYLK